jgi:hypothetical protein
MRTVEAMVKEMSRYDRQKLYDLMMETRNYELAGEIKDIMDCLDERNEYHELAERFIIQRGG